MMHNFSENTARIVAADVQGAVCGIDTALLDVARCSVTLLEAAGQANLPVAMSQGVLRAVHESSGHALDARESFIKAINRLNIIKKQSNQAPLAVGCPGPTPISAKATMDDEAQAKAVIG